MQWVSAGDLAANAETLAPVSGPHCSSCGASPRLRAAKEVWAVRHGDAWCPDCLGVLMEAMLAAGPKENACQTEPRTSR